VIAENGRAAIWYGFDPPKDLGDQMNLGDISREIILWSRY
jgi:hypothetical protein